VIRVYVRVQLLQDLRKVLPPTEIEKRNGELDGVDDDDEDDGADAQDEEEEEQAEEADGDEEEVEIKQEKDEDDDEENLPFEENENGEIEVKDEDDEAEVKEEEDDEEEANEDEAEADDAGEAVAEVPGEPEKEFKRQTFVFSATLTIGNQGRTKLGPKPSNRAAVNALGTSLALPLCPFFTLHTSHFMKMNLTACALTGVNVFARSCSPSV
jgi:hypothetical protein